MSVVRWSRKTDQLVRYIAQNCQPSLQSDLGGWIQSRPLFAEFVVAHQDKIRKKLSTASDREVRLDVRAELLVAYLVLGDRRFDVAFETAGSSRAGPDLSLRYRANIQLNLEVTRPRSSPDASVLASTITGKLRQLPGGVANAVVIVGHSLSVSEDLLLEAVKLAKSHAERKDDAFFTRRGLTDARSFYVHFVRLGGIFLLDEAAETIFLANREARHPIPDELLSHLRACLGIMARA